LWYRLASHLGQPLQRVQRETTAREFVEWQEFLDKQEWQSHGRQDYQMALIAMETAKGHVKNPQALKLEDFLVRFSNKTETKPKPQPVSDEEKQRLVAMSKARWFILAGKKPPPGGGVKRGNGNRHRT